MCVSLSNYAQVLVGSVVDPNNQPIENAILYIVVSDVSNIPVLVIFVVRESNEVQEEREK